MKSMNAPKVPGREAGFRLAGFPKEFERNLWEELDKRFWSILLLAWVILYSFVFFMTTREWKMSEEDIQRLKEKVIRTVYSDIIIEQPKAVETAPTAQVPTTEEGGGAKEEEAVKEKTQKIVKESAAQRAQRRRSSRVQRARRTRQMEQAVATTGILGIVTAAQGAGGGSVAYGDVLKEIGGAGGTKDIGEVVAGTAGLAAATRTGQHTRVAKGGGYRKAGEGMGIDELIEGTGVSAAASIRRRGKIKLKASDTAVTGAAAGAGTRDQEHLLIAINENKASIEACIQRSMRVNPNLHGRIDVEVIVDPSGRVVGARIVRSNLHDKRLERCVLRAVKRWHNFGKSNPKLGNVKLRFPFVI